MTIQWSAIGGGLPGGSTGANILPEEVQNGDDAITFGQDSGVGDQQDYEAFVAWRAKGKDSICINCAEKGHTIANCPKPAVPMKDRPCLRCRKTGHMAWNCPEKPKGTNTLEEDSKDARIMCMMEESYGCCECNPGGTGPESINSGNNSVKLCETGGNALI